MKSENYSRKVINKNFLCLASHLWYGSKRGVVLEGSSRSGKTWSILDFIIQICAAHVNEGLVINIVKETYNSFKTTLFDDFNKRLNFLKVPNPFTTARDVPSFHLFGNKIAFLGADNAAKLHGASSDYFWINEALDVQQAIFDQLEQRCRKAFILDYNPKCSEHWIYNRLEKRPDIVFFHTTLLDNPFVSKWEKAKILSYEPTPENIERGTADSFMWKVYGQGLRGSPEGLIFPYVNWIDKFPDDVDRINYGMDFGFTNSPTALIRSAKRGNDLFIEKLLYSPIDNPDDLAAVIKKLVPDHKTHPIWSDAAHPETISHLRRREIACLGAKKQPGSIQAGISLLKTFKLNLVRDADFRREQENYTWRNINGIALNEPIDDFNHIWDAVRYCAIMEYNKRKSFII